MAGNSALAAVVSGNKNIKGMSETAAKSALADAAGKLTRQQKQLATMKENAGAAATAGLHAAEMHGSAFLASFASGYRGEDGLKLGPVDARLLGVPLVAWGLYECLTGKGGGHQLAIGNGLIASYGTEQALMMGAKLRDMRDEQRSDGASSAPQGGDPQLSVSPGLEDEPAAKGVREVLMHPAADGHRPHRPPPPNRRHPRR